MQIKHKFPSPKTDGADSTVVRPSNWNDVHDAISAAGSIVLGRDTSGSGPVQELPIAVTPGGDASLPNARGFFLIAAGTTAQRPASPVLGMVRYNTDTGLIEFYNGAWTSVANASTASVAYVDMAIANLPSVRQTTVGPVNSVGLPSLLPPTSVALSVTSQNVSSSAPFVATAANNNNATTGRVVNSTGVSAVNLTWSGLTASRTAANPNFLYVTVNPDATLMTGVTLVPPIYQWGGVPAVTNGQFTFNIGEMKGYMGNGSTAPQANIVFVGEAATDSSSVISTVAYAYNGMYEGTFAGPPLPAASVFTSVTHNLGVTPRNAELLIECVVAEQGYSVGDQVMGSTLFVNAGGSLAPASIASDRLNMGFQTGSVSSLSLLHRTSGNPINLLLGNWKFKFFANRNW